VIGLDVVGLWVEGLWVVGFAVPEEVVGLADVGGADIGLLKGIWLGMEVGLIVVCLVIVGLLVMGCLAGLIIRKKLAGITSNALTGYSHAMAKLSLPPPSFMRALIMQMSIKVPCCIRIIGTGLADAKVLNL
jgi:hypothetical protein